MESTINIKPIGIVEMTNQGPAIRIREKYRPGLINMDGFVFLHILWWGNRSDSPEKRSNILLKKPYTKGPDELGVFATRSEERPNPILLTVIYVQSIDPENGLIYTPYIDAEPSSPVLDIKPYHKIDRIKNYLVPDWCDHWPEWGEEAGQFDWENEFNF